VNGPIAAQFSQLLSESQLPQHSAGFGSPPGARSNFDPAGKSTPDIGPFRPVSWPVQLTSSITIVNAKNTLENTTSNLEKCII
jgi:hypothetical protein